MGFVSQGSRENHGLIHLTGNYSSTCEGLQGSVKIVWHYADVSMLSLVSATTVNVFYLLGGGRFPSKILPTEYTIVRLIN